MAEPRTIAGHIFEGAGSDRRCVKLLGDGSMCGKYWDDIKHVNKDHCGQKGFAHLDTITMTEIEEVEKEVKRMDELFGPGGYKS